MENRIYLLIMLFTILFSPEAAHAQVDGQLPDNIKYRAWVTSMDGKQTRTKRFLTHVQDSLIILANEERSDQTRFYYYNINHLSLRKKGKPGRGILLGAVGGFVAGFSLGYADAQRCGGFLCFSPLGIGAVTGGLGAFGGGLVGAIIGTGRINIPINGKTANQKQEIRKKLQF